ncbi:MAG: RimK/LysX family protein [Nanoarchaeota archaeon]
MEQNRLLIGFIEDVILESGKKYKAKIDTGADSSSIDKSLVEDVENQKIVSYKIIKSALGRHKRPAMMINVEMQGIKFYEKFTLVDRSNLKYKILIGKDILKKEGFLIDPKK